MALAKGIRPKPDLRALRFELYIPLFALVGVCKSK